LRRMDRQQSCPDARGSRCSEAGTNPVT